TERLSELVTMLRIMGGTDGASKYKKLLGTKRSEQKVEPPCLRALEGKLGNAVSYYERLQSNLAAQCEIPIEDILEGEGPPTKLDSLLAPESKCDLPAEDKEEAAVRLKCLQQAVQQQVQQLFGAAAEQAAQFREEQKQQLERLACKKRRVAEEQPPADVLGRARPSLPQLGAPASPRASKELQLELGMRLPPQAERLEGGKCIGDRMNMISYL
ncbi:unnamed protein product, partial [Prorocentrum cordatum]